MTGILRLFSIETIIRFILSVARVSPDVWPQVKSAVLAVEQSDREGEEKFKFVEDALVTLFPSINRGWLRFCIQAAWFVFEQTGWAKGAK